MLPFKKKPKIEEGSELDEYVEKKINRYPKAVRGKLRMLYKEYKAGNVIFPEGFDKDKFLNKE